MLDEKKSNKKYSWIADQRDAHKKINSPTNQKGYNNFETIVGKLVAVLVRQQST